MKKVLALVAAVLAVALLAWLGATRGATASDNTVEIEGGNFFEANEEVSSDLQFDSGSIEVESGTTVTWEDRDDVDEPHTISIVVAADLPASFDEFLECGAPSTVCEPFLAGHFPNGPVPVLSEGSPGLDTTGDSLLLLPGDGSVSAVISAAPGTTLSYICVIHAWMQGTIEVVGDDDDD